MLGFLPYDLFRISTYYLTFQELMICVGFSTLIFVWIELEMLFIPWYKSQQKSYEIQRTNLTTSRQ
jgi:hypothetical protein